MDRKISVLPSAVPLTGPEILSGVQSGANVGLTVAQIRSFLLSTQNSYSKGQSVTPVALTDGATLNTDASLSNNFTLVLGGTGRTLANPTNLADGQIINWYVKQDAVGSKTITVYGSLFKWPGGTVPTLSTPANSVDLIVGQYISSLGIIACNFLKGFA